MSEIVNSKKANIPSEDKLGNLPETVLGHILSLLPTSHAVRTSILSKNWRYKWHSITNLYFDDYPSGFRPRTDEYKRKDMFVNFVERVLLLLRNSRIQEFHLACNMYNYDPNRVLSWILFAMRHDARKIRVICCSRPERLPSFPCFTNWPATLEELRLKMSCVIEVVPSINVSCLKLMELRNVTFRNDPRSSSKTVQFCFMALEALKLEDCQWENVSTINIYAPKLTSLCIISHDVYKPGCLVELCTPRLTKFECRGSALRLNLICPTAIVDLCIHVDPYTLRLPAIVDHYEEIIQIFSGAKTLAISSKSIQEYNLPELNNLTRLTIVQATFNKKVLALLRRAPNLESLTFSMSFSYNHEDVIGASNIPECVTYHLKVVKFILPYGGSDDWIKLAIFFLKNAAALEKMIIDSCAGLEASQTLKLTQCPKRSASASIVFDKRIDHVQV